MTCDETFYHRYLNGDDAGLEALMKKYGNPLTLYIDGYLHDVHEAEDLMLDVFAYLFPGRARRHQPGGARAHHDQFCHETFSFQRVRMPAALNRSSSGCTVERYIA